MGRSTELTMLSLLRNQNQVEPASITARPQKPNAKLMRISRPRAAGAAHNLNRSAVSAIFITERGAHQSGMSAVLSHVRQTIHIAKIITVVAIKAAVEQLRLALGA